VGRQASCFGGAGAFSGGTISAHSLVQDPSPLDAALLVVTQGDETQQILAF
jgi:hypothetical protein